MLDTGSLMMLKVVRKSRVYKLTHLRLAAFSVKVVKEKRRKSLLRAREEGPKRGDF